MTARTIVGVVIAVAAAVGVAVAARGPSAEERRAEERLDRLYRRHAGATVCTFDGPEDEYQAVVRPLRCRGGCNGLEMWVIERAAFRRGLFKRR